MMRLVRCTSAEEMLQNQTTVGNKYWIDDSTSRKINGYEYAKVYLDEAKTKFIGTLKTCHFKTIYRYLNYGDSLGNWVNTNRGFILKDIISWCLRNPSHQLSEKLLFYIKDNNLDIKENLEKEFIVNSVPFKEFQEKGMEKDYLKYLGYYLRCID